MSERLGAKIERLRTGRGWSRADLERHSGITESTIYRVERGVREARKTTVNALLTALTRPSEAGDGQTTNSLRRVLSVQKPHPPAISKRSKRHRSRTR